MGDCHGNHAPRTEVGASRESMRQKKAKKIRREFQDRGLSTKTKQLYKMESGQIVADKNRRMYQKEKKLNAHS